MALLRNFATVGGATLSSRVLGFVRDIMMAAALGTGPVADAFVVAFRFPNLFRRLFAEGAFNSAFVPLFARTLEGEGKDEAKAFAQEAMAGLLATLLLLSAIAIAAMPILMLVLAPGFIGDEQKFDLTVFLTRITFPYLTLVSLLALISGVLNGLGRFAVAAFAPTMLNVVLIGVLWALLALDMAGGEAAGMWLAIGVVLGGIAQLAMVVIELQRAKFPLKLVRPRWSPGMKRLVALGIPGVIAGGITQINIVVGTMIASLQDGAVALLYYADRLYQLPLGVVGIAIGVVLLPELSRRLKAGDDAGVQTASARSLEFSMLLTLPAAVALAAIPGPLVSVLFERGAFDETARLGTAAALQAFAVGLPSFVLIKVFSPAFFAREDTKTPMKVGALSVAVNVATSLAGWVNALVLYALMKRRDYWHVERNLLAKVLVMLVLAVLMGGVLIALGTVLQPWLAIGAPMIVRVAALGVLIVVGLVTFFGLAHISGVAKASALRSMLTRRASS